MLKAILKGFLGFIIILLLFIVASVGIIERIPLGEQAEYVELISTLDHMEIDDFSSDSISVGWSKVNITPDNPTYMAGFGRRGPFKNAHDSLYARITVLDNGSTKVAIISLDLLMFPGSIANDILRIVKKDLNDFSGIFFGATHTHHGFGEWEPTILGQLAFGPFNESMVTSTSSKIVRALKKADHNSHPSKLDFRKIRAEEFVTHRIDPDDGIVDPFLRVLTIEREDGSKGLLTSYSAHPVNIDADLWTISRDYPGELVDALEEDPNIDFAIFLAGMVGSHRSGGTDLGDFERTRFIGRELANLVTHDTLPGTEFKNYDLSFTKLVLPLVSSHLRLSKNLQLRDWLFRYLLGPLRADIRILRIGDLLMLGMPCDFSGEISQEEGLDAYAAKLNLQLMITSFNSNYIGYITSDKRYDLNDHDEIRILNWVGPYKGAFFTTAVKEVIDKSK